ncbi:MAG: response regulator [Nonlabens sp.]
MILKKKLKNVLLIDDSESDNFFHSRQIRKSGITDEIKITHGGEEALEFLQTECDGVYPQPTLIFLDINMPGMDGWEFLDEYEKLDEACKGGFILTMLSNSIDQRDKEKATTYNAVKGFYRKPLQEDYLIEIMNKYFPEYIK